MARYRERVLHRTLEGLLEDWKLCADYRYRATALMAQTLASYLWHLLIEGENSLSLLPSELFMLLAAH
jgi:hypothetical protein